MSDNIRLGVSYWGFCEELSECTGVNTPDGGRYTRPLLMKELNNRGHELFTMQKQRGKNTLNFLNDTEGKEFPEIDALFIEWRWSTYKNDKNHPDFGERSYEPDLDRQRQIMRYYCDKVPIIIFDTDFKYEPLKCRLPKNVIVFEPAIHARDFARSLLYWSDFKYLFNPRSHNNTVLYLGSNYERYWAVEKYYLKAAKELQDEVNFVFVGNWLEKSPERPEQEEKVNEYSKYIDFYPRNTMQEGFSILSHAITTIHIGKKKYMKEGVITPRYLESIVCGTPALIPEEFNGNPYGNAYKISDYKDVIRWVRRFKKANKRERRMLVNGQKNSIKMRYDVYVEQAVNKILNAIEELR